MAVGTVSASTIDEPWQLITTTTFSSATANFTYNALSGYKHIWVVMKITSKSGNDYISVRPNNDTAAGWYAQNGWGYADKFYVGEAVNYTCAGSFKIYDVDQAMPHKVELTVSNAGAYTDAYINPVAITSIVVGSTGSTINGGTIYVYGIAA